MRVPFRISVCSLKNSVIANSFAARFQEIRLVNDLALCAKLHFKDIGHDGKTADITYENVQARMRTMVLMNKANQPGGMILPTISLSLYPMAYITRLERSSMLDVLGQDYVRTARAKGVSSVKVIFGLTSNLPKLSVENNSSDTN